MANPLTKTDIGPRPADYVQLPEQREESNWAFLAFAWRRKWVVVLLLVVAFGLGYLFYLKQTPVYESMARILVVKEGVKLPFDGIQLSASYDKSHETLINSPIVLKAAVNQKDLMKLPSFQSMAGEPDAVVGVIMKGLEVEGIGGDAGDVLELRYRSLIRGDCQEVLDGVCKAYGDFLSNTQRNQSEEAVSLIRDAKEELDKQIQDAQKKYREFRESKDVAQLLYTGQSAQNVHEERLQRIESVRSEATLTRTRLQADIATVEAAIERGDMHGALRMLATRVPQTVAPASSTESNVNVEDQVFPMLLEEKVLLENYGQNHPKVQEIRKRIEMTRAHLAERAPPPESQGQSESVKRFLASLYEQVTITDQTITEMNALFEKERESARVTAAKQAEDQALRSEIDRRERLFNAVVARLEELSLAQKSRGAHVEPIHPATSAYQVEPNFQKIMLIAGLLGAMAGLGLAFVVDTADRRFRSPDEIRSDFGIPVVGHIPVIPIEKSKNNGDTNGALSPALRVHHHPRGRIAEAYRAVRTALFFSTRGSGHKVFQVTSPSPGDGKTTLSANLAVSIAQSGKKVLLVDCDFRRPRCHTLFNIESTIGMSSVIAGTAEIIDAVVPTHVNNLSLIPCGERPENPAELLTSPRFEELLNVFRDQYDVVIVDTPPALAVTDPLNVAPRVDGVLLVLRLTKNARVATHRALETVTALGGNVIGIVVNGLGGGPGGYGYGKYGYGYGYGYGYKYGYGYGYGHGRYGGYRSYGGYGGYGGYGEYGYAYSDGDGDGYGCGEDYLEDESPRGMASGKREREPERRT